MSKTYILQKEWPDAEIGDKYQWNGQGYSNQTRTSMVISKKYVEEYPEWFLKEEKKITLFQTKRIKDNWYCYATHRGYDYSFCSDNEYHAVELAKRIMDKNGWLAECEFPETLKSAPQAENKPEQNVLLQNEWSKRSYNLVGSDKPDWEITRVISKTGSMRGKSGDRAFTIEEIESNGDKIHSVKRLSDDQVFSVGDEVGYDNGNVRTQKDWKIDHFYIRESDGALLARSKDCGNVEYVDKWLYKSLPPQPQKEEQRIDVDLPLGITMREIASCITNYVRKSNEYPFLTDRETTVIDHKKLEEVCKTHMRKLFTQQQVDELCEKAFNAGRERFTGAGAWSIGHGVPFQYPTFQDYKNSKQ